MTASSIERWRPEWERKASAGETVAELSGRSVYDPWQRLALVRDAVSGLELKQDDSLLDIGCAAGYTGVMLAELCGKYAGVDYSHGALRRFPGYMVVQSSATALPFRDGAFEKSYMGSVLLCMSKAECLQALREMRRVTRARGYVADTLVLPGTGSQGKDVTWFRVEEYVKMLREAGWSRIALRKMDRCLPHSFRALDAMLWA